MGPPTTPIARQPAGPPPPGTSGPGGGRGGGGGPRRLAGRLVGALAVAVAVSVFLVPDLWFGLDRWSPFAQLVAFRPVLLVVVAVLVVVLALITISLRKAWPFPVALLVVLGVGASMVLPRAIAEPVPTTGTPLKVLSFNVYDGGADVQALADLIRAERPDLIALPESGERFRQQLEPLIADLGYTTKSTASSPRAQDVDNVTVGVASRLGNVTFSMGRMGGWSPFPYLQVTGGGLGNLTFVGFHSVAPTPGAVSQWETDLAGLQPWCSGSAPYIVAGDYNATLDHSVLRAATQGCGDAATQRGASLTPTWPAWLPDWLGTEIDHVFSNAGTKAEAYKVVDMPGSDHRTVVTTLRLAG